MGMHQHSNTRSNIQNFCMLITLLLWVLYGSQNKAAFALYSINRYIFMTEVESVYCAVCTESFK